MCDDAQSAWRRCSDRALDARLNLHPESRCLHAIPVLFEIRWGSRRDEQVPRSRSLTHGRVRAAICIFNGDATIIAPGSTLVSLIRELDSFCLIAACLTPGFFLALSSMMACLEEEIFITITR